MTMMRRNKNRIWSFEALCFCSSLISVSLLLEPAASLSTAAAGRLSLSSSSVLSSRSSSVEDQLVHHASPLPAATSKIDAAKQLVTNGVCRINNVVSGSQCSQLRDYLLESLEESNNAIADDTTTTITTAHHHQTTKSPATIPRTRLNCGVEPLLIPLNHRTDMLLPLENPLVRDTLQHLVQELGQIYEEGVRKLLLPPSRDTSTATRSSTSFGDDCCSDDSSSPSYSVQLLEAASLVSEHGATHQPLHPDFRRDSTQKESRLPPRLVTFLYLQDAPTKYHGPTIFLPRTNTPKAHQKWFAYKKNNHNHHNYKKAATTNNFTTSSSAAADGEDHNNNSTTTFLDRNKGIAVAATLLQGDVAIYDASLLHFGSANQVHGNTRAVFYFGVGNPTNDDDDVNSHKTDERNNMDDDDQHCDLLPPVTLEREKPSSVAFWNHQTLSGYQQEQEQERWSKNK